MSDAPWEVGQHPAISNGWIVRPVLMGPNVRVLPPHEGGHVLLKSEADAHVIAAARDMCRVLFEMFVDGPVDVAFAGNPLAIADLQRRAEAALNKARGAPVQ